MASKLGTGRFSNVYGIGGNNFTAGQKDYAARMMQIEKQREEYYKQLGTPPGVPTMKGATADPDNTGIGYNSIIIELGDHSVPEGWIQHPKFNGKGDVPGPPIQWSEPESPDNAQPGYAYIANDTTKEETFFYHSDHLGSTSYITDAKANITQFDAYLPYGELLVDEHTSSEDMPYKFNGKEFDEETGLYYYGARYYDPRVSLWISTDILEEKNYGNSSYAYTYNPITFIDPIGTDTINISYVNKKWKIDAPIIADGNDVFNVANGDKKETYEFSQGEHGKRVNLLNLEIGETKDSYTLGVYHISGEADNGTGFYVAPGGEPSTKNGSGRRIPDGTYPIINPTAGSQWIKPGVGGNVSKRGIRFHYGGTNPRSWTEGCFVLSSGYSVNGNTIHYNADESKTASRNFDNALGAIGHFSYRPKSRTYNREGATFNAPIKHTLILKSRKK